MKLQPTQPLELFNDTYRIEVIDTLKDSLETYQEYTNLTLAMEAYSRLSRQYMNNRYRVAVYMLTSKDMTELFK